MIYSTMLANNNKLPSQRTVRRFHHKIGFNAIYFPRGKCKIVCFLNILNQSHNDARLKSREISPQNNALQIMIVRVIARNIMFELSYKILKIYFSVKNIFYC